MNAKLEYSLKNMLKTVKTKLLQRIYGPVTENSILRSKKENIELNKISKEDNQSKNSKNSTII